MYKYEIENMFPRWLRFSDSIDNKTIVYSAIIFYKYMNEFSNQIGSIFEIFRRLVSKSLLSNLLTSGYYFCETLIIIFIYCCSPNTKEPLKLEG